MIRQEEQYERLKRDGFLLLDAGLAEELATLRTYIYQNFAWPDSGFYYSLLSNAASVNRELDTFIHETLAGFYDRFFVDYRMRTGSFLVKPASTPDELYLHQDWCYTDEHRFNAYNVWIPMDDVTGKDGALFFVPGSHLWFDNLRSGSLPTARISQAELPEKGTVHLEVKKGQAVLFHPAVFHGSMPNSSAAHRVIVTATVFPMAAPFLYYDRAGDDSVDVYQLPDEAFLTSLGQMAYGGAPDAPLIGSIPYRHRDISARDISKMH